MVNFVSLQQDPVLCSPNNNYVPFKYTRMNNTFITATFHANQTALFSAYKLFCNTHSDSLKVHCVSASCIRHYNNLAADFSHMVNI